MVLFKYNNKFYRGQVLGIDSQGVNISFVDYGYMESIDPNDVYKWHPRWNTLPGEVRILLHPQLQHLVIKSVFRKKFLAFAYRCSLHNIVMRSEGDREAEDIFKRLALNGKFLKAKIM